MSAETFTTAMFLITAVIAAGVLINAIFPVVYTMAGTFQSATHESDQRLRTDFTIVTTLANYNGGTNPGVAQVWMKNVGSASISVADITKGSDVFAGQDGNFARLTYDSTNSGADGTWYATLYDTNKNNYWDPGETLQVIAYTRDIPAPPSMGGGNMVYFQFILPDGIWRSTDFGVYDPAGS
jgi:archaeal flagellar protein FlaG